MSSEERQPVEAASNPADATTSSSDPEISVTSNDFQAGIFALLVVVAIAVPFFLLLIVIINIGATILSTISFELVGHILLRAYGHKGSEIRLKSSVKVGAVGGAIVAIPFGIIYTTLEAWISPPLVVQDVEEQDAREPLLGAQATPTEEQPQEFQRVSKILGIAPKLNDTLRRATHNPFQARMYNNQRVIGVESPSKIRLWLALLVDCLSGPALGAASGAVGSVVLRKAGHTTLDVASATEAGAIGGFVLGALLAFTLSALCTCAFGAAALSLRI